MIGPAAVRFLCGIFGLAPRLILGTTFNTVDNDELKQSAGRLQLEPKLFLHGDKDAASIGIRITGSSTRRRIEFWESNIKIETAAQAGSVQHWSVAKQRQHSCERAEGLTATDDGAAHFTRASHWLARCRRRNTVTCGFRCFAIDRCLAQLGTGDDRPRARSRERRSAFLASLGGRPA